MTNEYVCLDGHSLEYWIEQLLLNDKYTRLDNLSRKRLVAHFLLNNKYARFDDFDLEHLIERFVYDQRWIDIKRVRWAYIKQVWSDFEFIEAKCLAGKVSSLLSDYDKVLSLEQISALAQMKRALILAQSTLSERPELAIQAVYNQLSWFDPPEPELQDRLKAAHSYLDKRGCWISAEAPLPAVASRSMLYIPFETNTTIQSLSPDARAIATASIDGKLNIHSLVNRDPESVPLVTESVTAIAFCENPRRLAWMDTDGCVHSDQGPNVLAGHSREDQLLYHPAGSILALRDDDALVAWQPLLDDVSILATDLPMPLVTLRFSPSGGRVIYVAGHQNPVIGVVAWEGDDWSVKTVPYVGPPVVDADCDPEGRIVTILRKDRSVQVVDVQSGQTPAHLFYEKRSGGTITGAPARCAYGADTLSGQVFFGTWKGNIAAWHWQTDRLEKYQDYCTVTDPQSLVTLAALPERGIVFYSTERAGSTASLIKSLNSPARHQSEVLGCFITKSAKVISAGKQDKTLCWSSADGLRLHKVRIHREITTIAPCLDTDEVLVGDRHGWIWIQPPGRDVTPQEIEHAFEGAVRSAFAVDRQTAIAADQTGRILRIQIVADQVDVLRRSQGWEEMQKLLPAGKYGLFWNLRYETIQGDRYSVVALQTDNGDEDVVFHSQEIVSDLAVSADRNVVCLAGKIVRVFRKGPNGWTVISQREASETYIEHVAFVGPNEHLLAVALADPLWLEIWQVNSGLRTVAAAPLPSVATCLSTFGHRIVIGCKSGDLISLCLNKNEMD